MIKKQKQHNSAMDNPTQTGLSGLSWKIDQLRKKSFEDLHALHFILLVERNKLLAVRFRARKAGKVMLDPTRLRKVKVSLARIQSVIWEMRQDSIRTKVPMRGGVEKKA